MKELKLCMDCTWSKEEEGSAWNLRCMHINVNMKDSWALSSLNILGTTARDERQLRWYSFPSCGMAGKLWEKKNTLEAQVKT